MEEENKEERYTSENNQKRTVQKTIAFIILIIIASGLYFTRDRWIPKMHSESLVMSDDEFSDSGFPVKVANGINYKVCNMGKNVAVLSDTRFYILSSSGKMLDSRTHTFSNTILKNAKNKVLIYEQNGNNFRIEGKKQTLYQKQTDKAIYMADLSNDGYAAVVTASDQYVCEFRVYDQDGDEVYFRGCSERIIDISFCQASKGCRITTISAEEGRIVSGIISINFSSADTVWKQESIDTCCVDTYTPSDNGIYLLGDSKFEYYNSEGVKKLEYEYVDNLIDASFYGMSAAIVFEGDKNHGTRLLVMKNPESGMKEVTIDTSVKGIDSNESAVFLLTDSSVEIYDYSGMKLRSIDVSEPYRDLCIVEKSIILIGHRNIDKIDY